MDAVRSTNGRSEPQAQSLQSQSMVAGTDRMVAMKEFQRLHPPQFRGDVDPLVAEEWLKSMNQYLDVLGIEDGGQRVSLVAFQLTNNARNWWDIVSQSVRDSWEQFEEVFRNQYILESAVDRLRQRFESLTQGDLSVDQYAQQFFNLSRFATDLVADERRWCRRFEKGLRPPIRSRLVAFQFRNFAELLKSARTVEDDWETFQKEKESQKSKGAGTSKRSRQGQKRKSFIPDSGPEVLKRSGNMGSSKGFRRSASGRPSTCHLCEQSGHFLSRCPKLQEARASISGPRPQQQRSAGSRATAQGSLVCYRCGQSGHMATSCPADVTCYNCDQSGHIRRDCPIKSDSSQTASTSQTFRTPIQFFRGGGQQEGRMTAMEIVEESSGSQEQLAQIIRYSYPPPPAQTFQEGGGYWPGQVMAMEVAEVQSMYPRQPVQTIRYIESPSAQPSQEVGGYRLGHVTSVEAVNEPGTSGRQWGAPTWPAELRGGERYWLWHRPQIIVNAEVTMWRNFGINRPR